MHEGTDRIFKAHNTLGVTPLKHKLLWFVVVFTLPLPQDEGTARTAIQVHAVNLIELG